MPLTELLTHFSTCAKAKSKQKKKKKKENSCHCGIFSGKRGSRKKKIPNICLRGSRPERQELIHTVGRKERKKRWSCASSREKKGGKEKGKKGEEVRVVHRKKWPSPHDRCKKALPSARGKGRRRKSERRPDQRLKNHRVHHNGASRKEEKKKKRFNHRSHQREKKEKKERRERMRQT